jgi:hypothetical protein
VQSLTATESYNISVLQAAINADEKTDTKE